MKHFLILILFTLTISVFGQSSFKAILLYKQDSIPIQFAVVKCIDIGRFTQTNTNGEFHFSIPAEKKVLHFEISAIDLHDTVVCYRTFRTPETIYAYRMPVSLSQATIVGLSAKETVKKAISLIPVNYTDSSFAAFSFYRQYEKINGEFKNLIEAQTVVSFKLSASKNRITSDYGFAIEQMRRSDYEFVINDLKYDDINYSALLNQNPVYNLTESSLNPNALRFYKFSFDTVSQSDDYIINYICSDFSSEFHGVSNFRDVDWQGESREEGQFVIDRKTFAFKKIERTAHRNNDFHYPKNNNFLLPSKRYYEEFVDGSLICEYQILNGKWFLKKTAYKYTNEFYNSSTAKKEFVITDIFEWNCDSVSHFINRALFDKFYKDTPLPLCKYVYDKSKWDNPIPPFYFFEKDKVYDDIGKKSTINEQFEKNGK